MTWARTLAEEALLARSLTAAATLGLPMSIADRNGRAEFLERLSRLPRATVIGTRQEGLVSQIAAAFEGAAGCDPNMLFYTEPDKEAFFAGPAARLLARASRQPTPALVLAARSPASFATFPPMQRYTEAIVNHLCAELIGIAGDYSYGPFLMPRPLLAHVRSLPADLGWGWRFAIFRAAARERLPIIHVDDELACPADQRDEDEADRAHRIRQLSENLRGLVA
jgi:hypothetical protein